MNYLVMNKNTIIAKFRAEETQYGKHCYYLDTNVRDLPFKLINLDEFIKARTIIIDRYGLKEKLAEVGIRDRIDLIAVTYGVSLTDTFWIKAENDKRTWEAVSPFRNNKQFDLSWFIETATSRESYIGIPDYSTDGNFPKCWITVDNNKSLVKCGTSGAYNAGLEPLSEILFTQIADYLHFENYVVYQRVDIDYHKVSSKYRTPGIVQETILIEKNKRFASLCNCFTNEDRGLVTAKELGLVTVSDIIYFAKEHCSNWKDICNIYLTDALGLNEDRPNGNLGFYFNTSNYEIINVAPMYDNNLSLLCYYDDRIDLQEYVNQLAAKDGSTFKELACKILVYIPEKEKYIRKIAQSFKFEAPFKILNNRLEILGGIVREQANMILK